jgi:hypothetical protein
MFCIFTYCDILRYVTLTFWNDYVLKLLRTVMLLRYVTPPFWNDYVLKLLHLETLTFRDAKLSDINVVWCYVLSQNPRNCFFCFISNGVMWHIKSFGLRQGFSIFTSHGFQNEFHVFSKQKNAFILFYFMPFARKNALFSTKSAKKQPFAFKFILCHERYQKRLLSAATLPFLHTLLPP